MNLRKMKIFITGVSSGLGKELAYKFCKNGHEVWGLARKAFHAYGNTLIADTNFRYIKCDVADRQITKAVFAEMRGMNFQPDVVILNAGVMESDLEDGFDYETFLKCFNVNLFGSMNLVDLWLPFFLERGFGKFVAISSLSSYRGSIGLKAIGYSSSKVAINMAFEGFRIRYFNSGVSFITINPGSMISGQERRGIFPITYKKAAEKIYKVVVSKKKSEVVNFPKTTGFLLKCSRLFRDSFLGLIISRKK